MGRTMSALALPRRGRGRPSAEVKSKYGGAVQRFCTAVRKIASMCSIALQHGVPMETIRRALMRDSRGKPNGPLGATLDAIASEGE